MPAPTTLAQEWTFARISSLTAKVFIVTGANSGIGRVTARELARKGAHVIMACRPESKTAPLLEALRAETSNANIEFAALDLLSLSSVDAFADAFLARGLPLHGLVLNAGIMARPFELSRDGIESQFATYHVAHFRLATRLLPALEAVRTPAGSSSCRRTCTAPRQRPKAFDGQSKLANILFAKELSSRLQSRGVTSVYGVIKSELSSYQFSRLEIFSGLFSYLFYAFDRETIDEDRGASTSLYLATDPEVEERGYRGLYFGPVARVLEPAIPRTSDPALAKKLWEFTEDLVAQKVGK
ncbi:hypothetical protein HK405_007525 [Cladochytrium tenue]|nr:hypothetical protein HK405_007525 [Cladochytrium tenue]